MNVSGTYSLTIFRAEETIYFTLKMESELSVAFVAHYQTTRRHDPEYRNFNLIKSQNRLSLPCFLETRI
jgi:hypothetical protein